MKLNNVTKNTTCGRITSIKPNIISCVHSQLNPFSCYQLYMTRSVQRRKEWCNKINRQHQYQYLEVLKYNLICTNRFSSSMGKLTGQGRGVRCGSLSFRSVT